MEYSLPHLKFAPTPQWPWWTSLSKSNHGGVSEETSQAWQPTLRGKFPSMLAFHPFKKCPPNAWVSPLQKNAPIKPNTSDWEIHFCTFLFILDEFFLKLKLPKKHHHFSQTFFWVIFHIDCHDFPKGMDLDFWKSLKATFEAGYDKPPARRVREWLAGSPWVSFQVVYSRNLRLVNCGVFFWVFFLGGVGVCWWWSQRSQHLSVFGYFPAIKGKG